MVHSKFGMLVLTAMALGLAALCVRQATMLIDVSAVSPGDVPAAEQPLNADIEAGQLRVVLPLETLSETRSRPLFDATRRPAADAENVAKSAPSSPASEATVDGFKLVGLMRKNRIEPRALIRAPGTLAAAWVTVGREISGWTLKSVDDEAVTLERDGRTVVLALFERGGSDAVDGTPPAATTPR